MKRKLVLQGLQAVSINNAYYNDKRHGFKPEVKQWFQQVAFQLGQGQNKKAISDVKQYFDESKYVFHVMFTFNNPNFYTKDGRISARSFDLSNVEKILLDSIFLPAHANSLNIDDKFVTRMISEKCYADEHSIQIVLHVKKASTSR